MFALGNALENLPGSIQQSLRLFWAHGAPPRGQFRRGA